MTPTTASERDALVEAVRDRAREWKRAYDRWVWTPGQDERAFRASCRAGRALDRARDALDAYDLDHGITDGPRP